MAQQVSKFGRLYLYIVSCAIFKDNQTARQVWDEKFISIRRVNLVYISVSDHTMAYRAKLIGDLH